MLLINGMPVIHIELKRSKVDVSQATFQIKRYTHEGVFGSGIFKMVQIFVAILLKRRFTLPIPDWKKTLNLNIIFIGRISIIPSLVIGEELYPIC